MSAGTGIASFRATLDGEECEVEYREGETLLDCMLAEGLDPAFQCMDAHCGTCMVKLVAGEIKMRKNKVLSKRDLEQDYVLLCQSIPLTDDVWVDCDG
ncbi:MAG: 2Fe-2S iron-sulfur cluster binding domain-containing protein [Gammaproteobacteria bacterium]|nr:2Fe-2S iron-sulfur cluster binding domain-containing protein [Gammaproteobacteria bacterium]